jgi:hypothetical protein
MEDKEKLKMIYQWIKSNVIDLKTFLILLENNFNKTHES